MNWLAVGETFFAVAGFMFVPYYLGKWFIPNKLDDNCMVECWTMGIFLLTFLICLGGIVWSMYLLWNM